MKTLIEMSQTIRLAHGYWLFAHSLAGECFVFLRLAEVKEQKEIIWLPHNFSITH